ncbi:unnamed protein product [Oppiella nova]|uniref:Gamma-interferon-inducible lysosomal thiol reductase n=1 Tax=Oppiella nova TaxID=334625 RepID=A0A7R9MDS2_9ACAR|nr:unnamed protein product [Oppiella nova]CAG2174298.1 unnamed protein product [Oppiella nova]
MCSIYLATILVTLVYIGDSSAAPNVKLSLYYESLCPYSRAFILNQLVPTYQKLESILTVDLLVPYGWAKSTKVTKPDGTFDVEFTCQHGVQECIGNEIHNCVLNTETIAKTLTLFGCMYNATDYKTPLTAGKECATKQGLNWAAIDECATGPLGRGLHLLAGEVFNKATPKPTGVPHILLNGQHTAEISDRAEKDLVALVCDTYTGTKPDACKK